MIRFLFNGRPVSANDERADLTVLEWLRLDAAATGTKEGCGSGDCGACTVVLAELAQDTGGETTLRYETANSCILYVGALHGKHLVTVEHLQQGNTLHAVQQAMVEQHGSQCGFCTPGFIMSMFALYHDQQSIKLAADLNRSGDAVATDADGIAVVNNNTALQHRIDRFLGGNLCRCTGYAPIKRAAEIALRQHQPDQFDKGQAATIAALQQITEQPPMHPRFLVPQTMDELVSMRISYPAARLLAGGTDLALETTQQLKDIDTIVFVKSVPELLRVEHDSHGVTIGAAVSLTRCMQELGAIVPDSKQLMLRFGSEQVRNQGTIGGNIANASPIGDLPPLLIALNAELALRSGSTSRTVSIESYFKDYKQTELQADEILASVRIPAPANNTRTLVYKISKRIDDDISAVCAVLHLQLDGLRINSARIAMGGMAAIPKRATAVEQSLAGKLFDEQAVQAARAALAKDFAPISDARASAAYRLKVAGNLIQRAQISLATPEVQTQVETHVGG